MKCKHCTAPIKTCTKECDFYPICKGYTHDMCGHYCTDAGGRDRLDLAEPAPPEAEQEESK